MRGHHSRTQGLGLYSHLLHRRFSLPRRVPHEAEIKARAEQHSLAASFNRVPAGSRSCF